MRRAAPTSRDGLTRVLKASALLKKQREVFGRQTIAVVMFVDLVGSTAYKQTHPSEEDWLPWLAGFLHGASEVIRERGKVVKYIGDEVMALFLGEGAVLNAEHAAEQLLEFARRATYEVKIAMDFGPVFLLDFHKFQTRERSDRSRLKDDPQGATVDRCARIAKRGKPDVVLASEDLFAQSRLPTRWRPCGRISAKGIAQTVPVYQLRFAGSPSVRLSGSEDHELHARCRRREATLKRIVDELKGLRDGKR